MSEGNQTAMRVLQAFEESQWAEIHLSYGDVEIHLSAQDGGADSARTSHVRPKTDDAGMSQVTPGSASGTVEIPGAAGGEGVAAVHDGAPEGSVTVPSPTPGIFWRAPHPGAPPFVEVDTRVSQGDPLCIVEVMKLMSTLSAPVDGTVARIGAANGEQIQSQHVLFHIVPDER
ncbi:MAG: biotin/lipoyl-containing protein [Acidimicrobiia bacterium]|nr:biotin/lipoyl-containing protein [Acidimicrobiia bacterium]